MQGIAGAPPFQQPDTLIQNVYDPQLLNRYAFERNNPWKNTDPSGHSPLLIVATAVVVLAIGLLGLSLYIIGSIEYLTNPNPTTRDVVYHYINAALTLLTLGLSPVVSAVTTATIPNLDITEKITDMIMENFFDEEEKECKDISCKKKIITDIKPPKKEELDQQSLKEQKSEHEEQKRESDVGKGEAIKQGKICVPGDFWVCKSINGNVVCENVGRNC